jgi:DNA polymerase-3 subunit epsilon
MGRCGAPCTGAQDQAGYAEVTAAAREAMTGDPAPVVRAAHERMVRLAADLRYEDAALTRERLTAFVRGAARAQRVGPLARVPEVVAARRTGRGGWELVCVRHGRLAGTTTSPAGADPRPYVEALRATAEQVPPPAAHGGRGTALAASVEETERVLAWLESEGVRLVVVDGEWSCPVRSASRLRASQLMGSAPLRSSTP